MTVYAIYNKDNDKIYIGQTVDLNNRLESHNCGSFKNSYTSRFKGRWKVIYKEEVKDRTEALRREKQLKSFRGREYIRSLISH